MKKQKSKGSTRIPPGVAAVIHHADGTVTLLRDPLLLNTKWKNVIVDSTNFETLTPPNKLYLLSREYLVAGIVLCERAGKTGPDLTWPQASVVYYCMYLATELFLKACLLQLGAKPKSLNHEVSVLHREYQNIVTDTTLHFSFPWSPSAKDINRAYNHGIFTGIDCNPDQFFRYGVDKQYSGSRGIHMFSPGTMFNYMKDLELKWAKAWDYAKALANQAL